MSRSQNPRYDPSRQGKNKRSTPATTMAERHPALREDPFAELEEMGGPRIVLDDLHPAMVPLPRQATGVLVADEGTLIDVDEAKFARRDRHVPSEITRAQIQSLAAVGTPHKMISQHMGITLGTLHKHYGHELATAKSAVNAMVAQSLLRIAMSGQGKVAVTAQMFWLKAQGGWRETERIEIARGATEIHEGSSGEAIEEAMVKMLERVRERKRLNQDVIDVESDEAGED